MTTTAVDDQFAPDEGEWNGKGLPPVGVLCEWRANKREWIRGFVIATFEDRVWLAASNGLKEQVWNVSVLEFRPIPTARDRWVTSACKSIEAGTEQHNINIDCSVAMRMTVEAIYDAIINGTLDVPRRD